MAVANFLASSHRKDTVSSITDVANFITALRTILCTDNDPAWTEPTTATFKSPVDAAGRWFSVLVEAIDTDTLQYTVKDQYGTTVRVSRQDITTTGGGTEIRVYSGQFHLWINSMRATPEEFISGMLDLSPRAEDAWSTVVYTYAYRDSTGSSGWTFTTLSFSNIASATVSVIFPVSQNDLATTSDNGGDLVYWPVFFRSHVGDQTAVLLGRMYQVILVPASYADGSQLIVPIDTGVTATFESCGKSATHSGPGTGYNYAIRAD